MYARSTQTLLKKTTMYIAIARPKSIASKFADITACFLLNLITNMSRRTANDANLSHQGSAAEGEAPQSKGQERAKPQKRNPWELTALQ